jgi:protein-S-isoprenylcysteine O-methyltransferase Ste14
MNEQDNDNPSWVPIPATAAAKTADVTAEEDVNPSWMEPEYDEQHQSETLPLLFGSGDVDLKDPDPAEEESVAGKETLYGSIIGTLLSLADKSDGTHNEGSVDDDDDELDDDTLAKQAKQAAAEAAKPHVPPVNACLWVFHLLEGICCVASLMLLTTQILPLIFMAGSNDMVSKVGITSLALRIYISLFCVLFMLTELQVPILRSSVLLDNYASRGFLYSFLGLVCVEQAYSERVKEIVESGKSQFHIEWVAIFMQISSLLMLGMGIVYIVLGMFCLKRFRDKLKQQEKDQWKKYRQDTKEWKEQYR